MRAASSVTEPRKDAVSLRPTIIPQHVEFSGRASPAISAEDPWKLGGLWSTGPSDRLASRTTLQPPNQRARARLKGQPFIPGRHSRQDWLQDLWWNLPSRMRIPPNRGPNRHLLQCPHRFGDSSLFPDAGLSPIATRALSVGKKETSQLSFGRLPNHQSPLTMTAQRASWDGAAHT
ncbi:hypothetical protein MRB53_040744 [Persea americana]|nr:hypothetical protein MRB53_040744 [Persea americana]